MQVGDLVGAERGCRLIEDQETRIVKERPCDLDELTFRGAQACGNAIQVDARSEARKDVSHNSSLGGVAEKAEAGLLDAQRDVLGHRELRDQVRVLEDHADAGVHRLRP